MIERLSDIGERELLNRIQKFMPSGQINDDTAEINPKNQKLLLNNDLLVEDIHFNEITASPQDIGWKAVTSNFSDLASSGVDKIIGITVGLVVPPNTKWTWVKGVYEGMKEALDRYGGDLLGGDCSNGAQKILSITAIGTLGKLRLHQSNALPGDYIIASGPHGLSRLGLALLKSDPILEKVKLKSSMKEQAILIHQRPKPPLEALETIRSCKPQDISWRAAATDSSDGLLEAIKNLCKQSKCQAHIDAESIPRGNFWPKGKPWDDWCINGGEDFELVISLPPSWAKAVLKSLPNSYLIGYMKEGKENIVWRNIEKLNINTSSHFKHF